MEQTFQELKDKAIDNLLNARELSTLLDTLNFVKYQKSLLEYKEISEYELCENQGRLKAYEEIETFLLKKVELLEKKIKNYE